MGSRFARFRNWTKRWFGDHTQPTAAPRPIRPGMVQLEDRVVPATFIVTNILDSQVDFVGGLSLRQAILAANNNPGFDRIEFRIPTSPSLPTLPNDPFGKQRYFPIVLATSLPELTDPAGVIIDATTQPRDVPPLPPVDPDDPLGGPSDEDKAAFQFALTRPIIQLLPDPNPGAFPGKTGAIQISGPNNTIRGMVFTGFPGSAITLSGPNAKNNNILGNWINTDITGEKNWTQDPIIKAARPPGLEPERANNLDFVLGGITILGGANHNVVGGMFDLEGRALVDAGGEIIGEGGTIARYKVGGPVLEKDTPIPITPQINRNVISGTPEFRKDYFQYVYYSASPPVIKARERDIDGAASGPGVRIMDPGTVFNLIQGNYIGTDHSGEKPIPNVNGIEIYNAASSNYVGNPVVPGFGNKIRFNELDGIRVAAHPNPSQMTTRDLGKTDPRPIPFDEGDDSTTVSISGITGQGSVPVGGGYGPAPGGEGLTSPYSAPFFDAYNANYFLGKSPNGGEIILLGSQRGPSGQVSTVGVESQVGTLVTIRGTNLSGTTSVGFTGTGAGLVQAKFKVITDSEVQVTIPEGAVTGPITISTPAGVFTTPVATILPSPIPILEEVSEFFPSAGVVGSKVTIAGTNLVGALQVLIGGVPASQFEVFTPDPAFPNQNEIVAVVPIGAKTGPINIITPVGGASTTRDFVVLTEPPPIITGVFDAAGETRISSAVPGQKITLVGTGFTGTFLVTFNFVGGGGGFSTTDFEVIDSNTIRVTVPPNATPSPIDPVTGKPQGRPIQVSSAGGFGLSVESLPGGFVILTPPTPSNVEVSPDKAVIGSRVRITGENLISVNSVSFGAAPARSFVVIDNNTIDAIVPFNAGGPISLSTSIGKFTGPDFTVAPSPAPTAGPLGSALQNTIVNISGTNLLGVEKVLFGDPSDFFGIRSPEVIEYPELKGTKLGIRVPVGASTGPVFIFTPGGKATSSVTVTPALPPTINIAPLTDPVSGVVGQEITIRGAGLLGTQQVFFQKSGGGVVASPQVVVINDTEIRAVVPQGAVSGGVYPRTPGGVPVDLITGEPITSRFVLLESPDPRIVSLFPTSGPVGTNIRITGSGLFGTSKVTIGGATVSNFNLLSDTQLEFRVPAGAKTGPITITTVPGKTVTSEQTFTVTPSPRPTISFSTPGSVRNSTIEISGTGLAGTTQVTVGGADAKFEVRSDVLVVATVPLTANSGTVSLTTPGGSVVSPTPFQILTATPPFVTQVVTDDVGVVGSQFFIDGKDLGAVYRVEVGNTPARFQHVGGKLLVEVPNIPSGASYAVFVYAAGKETDSIFPDDTSYQTTTNFLGQKFEYGEKIQVLPNASPVLGSVIQRDAAAGFLRGAPIRITGSGLLGAQTVTIGGVDVPNTYFTVVNDTAIDLNIPTTGLTPGAHKVTVTGPNGVPSKDAVTITIGDAGPLTFAALPTPGSKLIGESVVLTAKTGSFYEVQNIAMTFVDAFSNRIYGTANAHRTFDIGSKFRFLDNSTRIAPDLDHPPINPVFFPNFYVQPGGKEAVVIIPTGFEKFDGGPDNAPALVNVVSAAKTSDGTVVFDKSGNLTVTNPTKTPEFLDLDNINGGKVFFNRQFRILTKAGFPEARAMMTVERIIFDAKDKFGNKASIPIERDNLQVNFLGAQTEVLVTLPTSAAALFGTAPAFLFPTGGVTAILQDGKPNASFTVIDQPVPQLFEYQTPDTPPFGNVFVENQIYDNGWVVDDKRNPVGPRDQANKFTAGILGIDFVTAGTSPFARSIPFEFGFARTDQTQYLSPGNQGRGGMNDGLLNSFPGDASINTFNNVVGGRFFGPNLLQNFPLLQVVQSAADRTTFSTALIAKPFRVYRIDYFWNPGFDDTTETAFATTNAGIGQEYIGSKIITTDAQGNGAVSFTVFVVQPEPVLGPDGKQLIDENGNPVFAPIPEPAPGEFRLPNNEPLPISAGQDANSTNNSKAGVVTATATDLTAPTKFGPSLQNGPDGTSRFSFFRRVDNATGRISGQVINDENKNGKLDPDESGAEGFRVQLFLDRADGTLSRLPVEEQITDASGVFDFGFTGQFGLPNGTHRIVIIPPDDVEVEFIAPPDTDGDGTAFRDVVILDQNQVDDVNFFVSILGTVPPTVPPGVPPTVPPGVPPTVPPGVPPPPPQDFGPLTNAIAVGSDEGGPPIVNVYNAVGGEFRYQFLAYDGSFTGGVRVAVGDVTGDGNQDIVTAPGPGMPGLIKIFNGRTNALIAAFQPYEDEFTGGVYVALGDLDGDGKADIITGTGLGGGPRVQAFRLNEFGTFDTLANFFPYEDTFRGGVLVAAGDVNGDGIADIVTGTGIGGGPRVQVFSGVTFAPIYNFFAYESTFRGGVFASVGDVDGDGLANIITGTGVGGGPVVKVFKQIDLANLRTPEADAVLSFFAYDPLFRGGVRVDAADADGDGRLDIITAPGPGNPPDIRALDFFGPREIYRFQAFDPGFLGGVFIGGTH